MDKQAIIAALREFVNQRPGLEWANYGEASSYRAEMRQIMRDRKEAHILLNACAWRDSITAEMMLDGFRAFSGRLSIGQDAQGRVKLDYCAGQYYPTEYRKAVCAVAASVLWDWMRDCAMGEPEYAVNGGKRFKTMAEAQAHANTYLPAIVEIRKLYGGKTAGDCLRSTFRREFGRGIASRWFN